MSRLSFLKSFFIILEKDLKGEWKKPYGLFSALLFSSILATIYNYSFLFYISIESFPILFETLFLSSLFFSATVFIPQSYQEEIEGGSIDILNISFLDSSARYFAKVFIHYLNLILFIFICIPIYALFFKGSFANYPSLFVCGSLCALSLSILSTLLHHFSLQSGLKASIFPLVLLPANIPVFLFGFLFLEQARSSSSLGNIPIENYFLLVVPAILYGSFASYIYPYLANELE